MTRIQSFAVLIALVLAAAWIAFIVLADRPGPQPVEATGSGISQSSLEAAQGVRTGIGVYIAALSKLQSGTVEGVSFNQKQIDAISRSGLAGLRQAKAQMAAIRD